jgi:hypothetical protein
VNAARMGMLGGSERRPISLRMISINYDERARRTLHAKSAPEGCRQSWPIGGTFSTAIHFARHCMPAETHPVALQQVVSKAKTAAAKHLCYG